MARRTAGSESLLPTSETLPGVCETSEGVRLRLKVTPRAHRDELVRIDSDPIRVKLVAPPVEGAANEALVKWLGRLLAVPRRDIEIVVGERSQRKTVRIRGLSAEEVSRRLVKNQTGTS